MIIYTTNQSALGAIKWNLFHCSEDFVPPLDQRTNIDEYAQQLCNKAIRFEAWEDGRLVGLVAIYVDTWFITNVSVLKECRKRGIASELLKRCINHATTCGAKALSLLCVEDTAAYRLYSCLGFTDEFRRLCWSGSLTEISMKLDLSPYGTLQVTGRKNFDELTKDTPTAKYAYSFDFDVMHPMMIRTFEPWFRLESQTLELGSFEGAFTGRLSEKLLWARNSITCVEASEMAARKLHNKYGDHMTIINRTFEEVTELYLEYYDNIFMTHVLEHVEDPVRVLKRVNDEWLAPGGRLFLACPNANAASRQIAVAMGKVPYGHAITADEFAHGHKRTYDLETLTWDAISAGLKVIHRGGIFFKALANFQLDKAKATGIIDDAYLEGCYQLGQVYPDLCASIYLICEKGEK